MTEKQKQGNNCNSNGNVFNTRWMSNLLDGARNVKKSLAEGVIPTKRKPMSYGVPRPSLYTAKWVIAAVEILSPLEMIDGHTFYPIRVTSLSNWRWIIKRRYSDFVQFQSNVDLRDTNHLLPTPSVCLPEKDMNSKNFTIMAQSSLYVEKRSKALQAYLVEQLRIANAVYTFDDTTEAVRRLRSELNYFFEIKLNTGRYGAVM